MADSKFQDRPSDGPIFQDWGGGIWDKETTWASMLKLLEYSRLLFKRRRKRW